MSNDNITVNFVSSTEEIVANQNIEAATSVIDFHSNGNCLVIGDDVDPALGVVEQLSALKCTVVCVDAGLSSLEKRLTESGTTVFNVPQLNLDGYMGAFNASVQPAQGDTVNLAVSVYVENGVFDLVLDLGAQPILTQALPPLGYFRGHTDAGLAESVATLPDMVGDFEKPKYFEYNPAICAHSRSELDGCNACMNACATNAIRSNGEGISVDPYLCQGCGSCATVCPSGAMTYAYPKPNNAIDRTRELLSAGGQRVLLLHNEDQQEFVDAIGVNDKVLNLLVEEVSAFGIDYWSAMMSAGVHQILLLVDTDMHQQSVQALNEQIGVYHELLAGLGLGDQYVQIITTDELQKLDFAACQYDALNTLKPSSFVTHNDKRQTLRNAIDALSEQLKPVAPVISMKKPAPFGVIDVDKDKCTLCMACVSVCPGKALLDGQDTPALRMIEANCLQCGLCEAACPESAISLKPQFTYDSIAARQIKTLNEEEPFNCIRCQKPFATAKIIQTMFTKLDGHWMFKDEKAKRRLKMCDDCRVIDMFEDDAKGIDVHKNENA